MTKGETIVTFHFKMKNFSFKAFPSYEKVDECCKIKVKCTQTNSTQFYTNRLHHRPTVKQRNLLVVELDVVFLGKDVNRATGLRKQIQINFQRHFFKGPEAQPNPKLQSNE